jgi:hypothetical protein
MGEWVAIVFAEGAFGRGTDMCEYKSRGGLGGYALKVCAVPCRNRRSKKARSEAQPSVGVEANAKPIGIVLPSPGILGVVMPC